jgi:hypothetical protein
MGFRPRRRWARFSCTHHKHMATQEASLTLNPKSISLLSILAVHIGALETTMPIPQSIRTRLWPRMECTAVNCILQDTTPMTAEDPGMDLLKDNLSTLLATRTRCR